jgi:hypothetical protein
MPRKGPKNLDDQPNHAFNKKFSDLNVDHEKAGGGYQDPPAPKKPLNPAGYVDPNVTPKTKVVDPNATEPHTQVVKGQNGGKRPGAGRPKGSKNQFSKHSIERLKELNFDPMLGMVELYHETAQIIEEMDDPNHARRYSAQAMASLLINKQKILNDLMRYGYRHVPEKIEHEVKEKKPFTVELVGVQTEPVEDAIITPVEVEYSEVEEDNDE